MNVPSVLSYIRGIEATEGDIINRLESNIVTNVGVKSFVKSEDLSEDDKKAVQNNIISAEKIYLPSTEDKLNIKYSLLFTGLCSSPDKINQIKFKKDLESLAEEVTNNIILTKMYAKALLYMILTGLYAERNRNSSSAIFTKIKFSKIDNDIVEEGEYLFKTNGVNIKSYPYDRDIFNKIKESEDFESCLNIDSIHIEDIEMFNKISDLIAESFSKKRSDNYILNISVENIFKLTERAPVYPSELFLENMGVISQVIRSRKYNFLASSETKKVKLYYKTLNSGGRNFGYTPEKILNSLRRFDMWYDEDFIGPITFEPQGNSSKYNKNFRSKKKDIVNLLNKYLENKGSLNLDEEFFILAMFIRGGLFNSESKKDKDKKEES